MPSKKTTISHRRDFYTFVSVLAVWGILGYGTGDLDLEMDGGKRWTTGVTKKGGAGKTTLACAMAVAGERAGLASVVRFRNECNVKNKRSAG